MNKLIHSFDLVFNKIKIIILNELNAIKFVEEYLSYLFYIYILNELNTIKFVEEYHLFCFWLICGHFSQYNADKIHNAMA